LNNIKKIALVVIVISIVFGSVLGLLVQSDTPPGRAPTFSASIIHTSTAQACQQIPRNFSNWLVLTIDGNRSGLNFISATIYSSSSNIRLQMPLNTTAFAYIKSANATFETMIVPLPNYWVPGDNLVISLSYYVAGFTPITYDIGPVPVLAGKIPC